MTTSRSNRAALIRSYMRNLFVNAACTYAIHPNASNFHALEQAARMHQHASLNMRMHEFEDMFHGLDAWDAAVRDHMDRMNGRSG